MAIAEQKEPVPQQGPPFSRRVLYSLLTTLLFLAGIELVCRVLFPSLHYPPFAERSGNQPGVKLITFTKNAHRPTLQVPKPADRFRIEVFGESAVTGMMEEGFSKWLQAIIDASHPEQAVEVLNFGVGGANSTKIRDWFFPCVSAGADLIILYIGNNELGQVSFPNPTENRMIYRFISCLRYHSRAYQALEDLRYSSVFRGAGLVLAEKFAEMSESDKVFFPVSRRQSSELVYRNNLREMILAAREAGIPVVVMSPSANLKDWPPVRSVHHSRLSPQSLASWGAALAKGKQALAQGRIEEGRAALEAALAIDPTYAEAHYVYAQLLWSAGQRDQALRHYQLAREWDDYPLRAPYRFVSVVRELAESSGAYFLDLDQAWARTRPDEIPGFDLFSDWVHFTAQGEYEVARTLFAELNRWSLIPRGAEPIPGFDQLLPGFSFTPDQTAGHQILLALLISYYQKQPEVLQRALLNLEQAKAGLPGEVLPHVLQAYLCARLHDPERARQALSDAYLQSSYNLAAVARRILPESLEIYQDQAVISLRPDFPWNQVIYRTWTYLRRYQALPLLEFGHLALEEMSYAFIWDPAQKRFTDATPLLQRSQEEKRRYQSASNQAQELNLFSDFSSALHLQAMAGDPKHGTWRAESSDSFLVIRPFPGDPLLLPTLRLRARLSAPKSLDNWAVIYWASANNPKFSEERKLTFHWPMDNHTRQFDIPLGRIIPILRERPIIALRIDFTTSPAEIYLKELRLLNKEL